jgi:hypothetical protein
VLSRDQFVLNNVPAGHEFAGQRSACGIVCYGLWSDVLRQKHYSRNDRLLADSARREAK